MGLQVSPPRRITHTVLAAPGHDVWQRVPNSATRGDQHLRGGPSPAEGKLILSGPRPPGHSYQADSKGSVVTVQELGKGQVFPCPPACPTRRVGKCQDSRPRRARRPGPAQEDRAHPLTLQGLTVQGHGGDRRDVNSGRASFGECFGPREAVGRAVHPCTCPRTSRWLSLHS